MYPSIKTMEGLLQEGYSFVDFLPYHEYYDGLFINIDGSLSKIFELPMIETELCDSAGLQSISDKMELLIHRLELKNLCCQFILLNDACVDSSLQQYLKIIEKNTPDIVKESAWEKINHIKLSTAGFAGIESNFSPKRIRCFFTVRLYPQWVHPKLKNKIQNVLFNDTSIDRHISREFQKHKEELNNLTEKIINVFKSCSVIPNELDEEEVTILLYRILNPKRSLTIPKPNFDQGVPIRDRILFNNPIIDFNGFVLDSHHYRVISLKEIPSFTTPGMFSSETNHHGCLLDLTKNFMIVINFNVPDQAAALNLIRLQKSLSFMYASNFMGDTNVEETQRKKEIDDTILEIFKGGNKLVSPRIHFILNEDNKEKADKSCDQILIFLNQHGCEGVREDIIGASLFLSSLPFNFDNYYDNFTRRHKRMVSTNLSDMLPVYGSFRGTKTPAQLYLNRRGEIAFFDPFDSNTNPHCVLIGSSGAGKSFFATDMIFQQMRLDSHIFVLDKGESYKKICSVLNGQYVKFEFDQPLTINPFSKKPDSESIAFLVELLSQMASGGDERDRLKREEEGFIQNAIYKVYEQSSGDREITLSDVIELMRDPKFNEVHGVGENMGRTLSLRLSKFSKNGPYGKFFDGPNQFNLESRFTVFELANLSSHKDLQLVVLLNIMFYITKLVSSKELIAKRKFLMIDEAWTLLKLKNTADFITNAFKTFRKYRCSTMAITQELADITRQESGIAILANAANKIILKQELNVVDLLKDGMALPQSTVDILKTLKTLKGQYSEALIITDSSSGVIRLVSYPFLYWIANTEPVNNQYLEKIIKEKENLIEAIHFSAKEFPYGIQ